MPDSITRLLVIFDILFVVFIAYKFVKAWQKRRIADMLFYGLLLILKKQ